MQDPDLSFNPVVGVAEEIGPSVRRLLAPNPSPMTYRGTNTYLLGETDIAVIDSGPDDPKHLAAILAAIQPGQRISHVLVTHAHLDHSPLAARLAAEVGCKVWAFGDAYAGRSSVMEGLALGGLAGGGEGIDAGFVPDVYLADGESVDAEGWSVVAHHTPGHFGNHLSFQFGDAVFSGDLVMGWATSLVSPPDGDLTDFMASCAKLSALGARVLYPGHGREVTEPEARIAALVAHRKGREREILAALGEAEGNAMELALRIYTETPRALMGAASRNVFAHLVDLHGKSIVSAAPHLSSDAVFSLKS